MFYMYCVSIAYTCSGYVPITSEKSCMTAGGYLVTILVMSSVSDRLNSPGRDASTGGRAGR